MPSGETEFAWYSWRAAARRGCAAPWRGFVLLARTPSLWAPALVPVAIHLAATALSLSTLAIVGRLWQWGHGKLRAAEASWFWELPAASTAIILGIAGLTAVWSLAQFLLCGRALERFVRGVEARWSIPSDEFRPMGRRDFATLGGEQACICGAAVLPALVISAFPFLGTVAAVALIALVSLMLAGRTLFAFPLALRNRADPEGIGWCERHFWHAAGLGLVALPASLIPVVGGVVLVSAAAGAVLLFRELDESAGLATPRVLRSPLRGADRQRAQG